MSATKPYAATVAKWLRDNGHRLGGLTGQDWPALKAAVHCAELWMVCDDESRQNAARAFGAAVLTMQPGLRYLAYHAIAHAGDWSHRAELWGQAQLEPLGSIPRCTHGP